jgi:hypothetical protein
MPLVWAIGSVVLMGLLIAGLLFVLRPQPPIPSAIYAKLSFSFFYVPPSSGYKIDPTLTTYDASAKVVIFHAKMGSRDMLISEQATPQIFNDVPEYYPKLIEKLNGYSDFDSINGKVSLTRPKELNGAQSAVFNGKGTLIFVRPNQALSDDDWRRFFAQLTIWK